MLPLARLGPLGVAVAVPLFFLAAARPVWDYVLDGLRDRRGEMRGLVSARLTLLGNRAAAEFEAEIRRGSPPCTTGGSRRAAELVAGEHNGIV